MGLILKQLKIGKKRWPVDGLHVTGLLLLLPLAINSWEIEGISLPINRWWCTQEQTVMFVVADGDGWLRIMYVRARNNNWRYFCCWSSWVWGIFEFNREQLMGSICVGDWIWERFAYDLCVGWVDWICLGDWICVGDRIYVWLNLRRRSNLCRLSCYLLVYTMLLMFNLSQDTASGSGLNKS